MAAGSGQPGGRRRPRPDTGRALRRHSGERGGGSGRGRQGRTPRHCAKGGHPAPEGRVPFTPLPGGARSSQIRGDRQWGAPGQGVGGSSCLGGTELRFGTMQDPWGWTGGQLAAQRCKCASCRRTTYSKVAKTVNFTLHFTTRKKLKRKEQ